MRTKNNKFGPTSLRRGGNERSLRTELRTLIFRQIRPDTDVVFLPCLKDNNKEKKKKYEQFYTEGA